MLIAAIYGLMAVVLSALGSHLFGIEAGTAEHSLFFNAVMFQLLHAILLMWLATQLNRGFWMRAAALSFILGVLLFCGGLYLLLLYGKSMFSWITPVGGSFIILGWLNLIIYGVSRLKHED